MRSLIILYSKEKTLTGHKALRDNRGKHVGYTRTVIFRGSVKKALDRAHDIAGKKEHVLNTTPFKG